MSGEGRAIDDPNPGKHNDTALGRLVSDEWQLPIAIATGVALLVGFSLQQLVDDSFGPWAPAFHTAGIALVWVSLGLGGIHGVKAAVESIADRKPDIDVLMVVGATLAASIGHAGEGALLLFMFTLAGALEHRALAKAKDAVARLSKLMPTIALKWVNGAWLEVDPESLTQGDVILIRPGQTLPTDGVVAQGASAIDQSTLTGESLPRTVNPGDAVYAGTLNQNGALEVEVTKPMRESSLQRVLDLVIEAQGQRQPMQRVIDTFSTPYTLSVFAFAIASLFFFTFFGKDAHGQEMTFTDAAYRAITLLIVASPCALVIATPTATLCGLNRAAREGLLVKGGEALERLARVRHVVVDKTGTLTTGKIAVVGWETSDGADVDLLRSIALSIEERSTHPIAVAITRRLVEDNVKPVALDEYKMLSGQGVNAVCDGVPVRIGTLEYVAPNVLDPDMRRRIEGEVHRVRELGGITAVMSYDGQAMVFALEDTPRPGAEHFVTDLRAVGVKSVVMLTVDSKPAADRVANELGIDQAHAELLPEDKVQRIVELKASVQSDGLVALIGDGVNDAPALATADIGLAMGGVGADAAMETADVVLLNDDLRVAPWSFGLARRVRRVMFQNLTFALLVISALAVFALAGLIPMGVGVIGHEGSTLIVVVNSLRILAIDGPPGVNDTRA